jgi:hypothetical protein
MGWDFFLFVCLAFCFLETGSHYVVQAGLELVILLPQPPKHWDSRHGPPLLAEIWFFNKLIYK